MSLHHLHSTYTNLIQEKQNTISTELRLLKQLNSGNITEFSYIDISRTIDMRNLEYSKFKELLDTTVDNINKELSIPKYLKHSPIMTQPHYGNQLILTARAKYKNEEYTKAILIKEKDNTLNHQNSIFSQKIGEAKQAYLSEKNKMLQLLNKHNLFLNQDPMNISLDNEIETMYNLLQKNK